MGSSLTSLHRGKLHLFTCQACTCLNQVGIFCKCVGVILLPVLVSTVGLRHFRGEGSPVRPQALMCSWQLVDQVQAVKPSKFIVLDKRS